MLHCAALGGHLELCMTLIQMGADINALAWVRRIMAPS